MVEDAEIRKFNPTLWHLEKYSQACQLIKKQEVREDLNFYAQLA